jgi:CMP-N,N'-diacetyllegionaminic acid synthase
MGKDILWIITARSGSKSIINKNIKLLNNIPLIEYRIKSALTIAEENQVWVSTDSNEYASIAIKAGAKVPFIRPDYLSNDTASSNDVILHAINFAEKSGLKFNFIGLLEPTSPLVYFSDLLNSLNILKKNKDASSIVAVEETRPNTFFIQNESEYLSELAKRFSSKENLGRQEFKKQITPSGGFYISRWDDFKLNKTFYTEKTLPYMIPDECSIEIDEPFDWVFSEFLIKEKIVDIKKIFKE